MKKNFSVLAAAVMVLMFFTGKKAQAYEIESQADGCVLTTVLCKQYYDQNIRPNRKVWARIKLVTNPIPYINHSTKHTLDFHIMLCNVFIHERGWKLYLSSDGRQATDLEVEFETRMNLKFKENLIIRSFVYLCDSSKLWNMVKYRGGDYKVYFRKVAAKLEQCILENRRLKEMN